MSEVRSRKKLIEVALPLEAVNAASAREKSIRHGHPSTLHLWWARRPLASARAVIFAQMVDDPSACPEDFPTEEAQAQERKRLFQLIERLVQWESSTDEALLEEARQEIRRSWERACRDNAHHPRAQALFNPKELPAFHDPFAGGGALPLEAQRLGLKAYASDLNPVAVLINKAMIEIPPRFAHRPPVNPEARGKKALMEREWKGAQGLAEDVRYYGRWMRDEALRRIGHLYPKVKITPGMAQDRPDLKPLVGQELTVIAWVWARTVRSPNPAFAHVEVPLASTFMLSTKPGKEAYVEPVAEGDTYRFTVRVGKPKDPEGAKMGTKLARGANFRCLMSGMPITGDYIKAEGRAGRMGARLMAIVAEGPKGRVYLPPTPEHEEVARRAQPAWKPDLDIPPDRRSMFTPLYGLTKFSDLFTPRQLVALTTFADLVGEAMEKVRRDALAAGLPDDDTPLRAGGTGARAYAEAVGVYLALALDKSSDYWSGICSWNSLREVIGHTFARQAIPMVWDYAEANPFCNSTGNWMAMVDWTWKALATLPASPSGQAIQADATTQTLGAGKLISTDPPYYDNIGYADLSDFFYVWLRRMLRPVFPELFATVATPKAEELVATPYRHGGKEEAEKFFLEGMTRTLSRLAEQAHPAFPVAIYYAFKQSESEGNGEARRTGWETFLEAVIRAGFAITGTWPMRTEMRTRQAAINTNALASSIVLVCRKRPENAPTAARREFLSALKEELPRALRLLQAGGIAPVDLAQAAIGPGMAVYTRYAKVLDTAGNPVTVREALALINQVLDEALAEQEGDFDPDTRWAIAWFEQVGFGEGEFGVAETLSKAKNTSVAGLVEAGILESRRGKVRLLKPEELPEDWDPSRDGRFTYWEAVHQLVRRLETGGEVAAAELLAELGDRGDTARELAYRLYAIAERKGWSKEALAYNALVQSWPEMARLGAERKGPVQTELFQKRD